MSLHLTLYADKAEFVFFETGRTDFPPWIGGVEQMDKSHKHFGGIMTAVHIARAVGSFKDCNHPTCFRKNQMMSATMIARVIK